VTAPFNVFMHKIGHFLDTHSVLAHV
jgi:hypothetical protein